MVGSDRDSSDFRECSNLQTAFSNLLVQLIWGPRYKRFHTEFNVTTCEEWKKSCP